MRYKYLYFLLATALLSYNVRAQSGNTDSAMNDDMKPEHVRKFYFSNGLDAFLFSSSVLQRTGESSKLSTLRFSLILNYGMNVNYDFNNHFGVLAGLGIKNIGFIEKFGDSTVKHRVYTIGVPVGIKVGNLGKHNFVMLGGGMDLPFNYREKGFVKRGHKNKFNEWFSDRTATVMPYLFAGVSLSPGITFKAQYYPGNFLNQDYKDDNGNKPYAGYEKTNLVFLSIGFDIHYKGKAPGMNPSGSNENVTLK
ncbi:hypothetical protein ACTHGU_17710 [Chitinophagaceae bacterium MMS25-I14]